MSVFENPELKHSPVEEKAWIEAMEDVQGGKSLTKKYGTRELFTPAKAQKFMSEKCDKELCPDCDDTYITVISIKSRVRSPFTGHHDWPAPQQQGQKQVVSDNPWLDQGGGLIGRWDPACSEECGSPDQEIGSETSKNCFTPVYQGGKCDALWVSLEPELVKQLIKKTKDFKTIRQAQDSDKKRKLLQKRVIKLLGLNPGWKDRAVGSPPTPEASQFYTVIRMKVKKYDLWRPCNDVNTTMESCDECEFYYTSQGKCSPRRYSLKRYPRTYIDHHRKKTLKGSAWWDHAPFTSLGYTYDWGAAPFVDHRGQYRRDPYGVSEYLLKPRSDIVVLEVLTLPKYIEKIVEACELPRDGMPSTRGSRQYDIREKMISINDRDRADWDYEGEYGLPSLKTNIDSSEAFS